MKHGGFAFGEGVLTATGVWCRTDIGTRTVIGVKVSGRDDPSWLIGSPDVVAILNPCEMSDRTTGWTGLPSISALWQENLIQKGLRESRTSYHSHGKAG